MNDPVFWVYVGVVAVGIPLAAWLAERYPSREERVRDSAGPVFVPMLAEGELLDRLGLSECERGDCRLRQVYMAPREPLSGIGSVYSVEKGGLEFCWVVVFRHNISCSVCRDILAVAVFDISMETIKAVVLLDYWEVRGQRLDTAAFTSQFADVPVDFELEVGKSVDGITGATFSTTGLVKRLNEARRWLLHAQERGEL